MKPLHVFCGGFLWLTACSTEPAVYEHEQTRNQSASIATVSTTGSPLNTVHQFLTWYSQHREQLNTMPFVPASVDGDTANTYAVDFKVVGSYLGQLQSSGNLSPAFLLAQRNYFQRCQDYLQTHLQTDGAPFGLDYDRILYTQDAESQVQLVLRSKPVSIIIQSDTAQVSYHWQESEMSEGPPLTFSLAQDKGRWLITAIRPVSDN